MSAITSVVTNIEDRDFTKEEFKFLAEFIKNFGLAMENLADIMSDDDVARFNTDDIAEVLYADSYAYAMPFLKNFNELPTKEYLLVHVLAHKLLSRLVTITTSEA